MSVNRDPYFDLCITAQALRRDLEGRRSPLATALGVAARPYAHQLLNVYRVLTDVRVRHLLADEVGLGKTIQALMILNALRAERPSLSALIITPDRLMQQWRDELLTRAHCASNTPDDDDALKGQIRIEWEANFRAQSGGAALRDIDPQRYQLLIVDELHSLTAALQDRIVATAKDFEHLLILTATPNLQHKRRLAQLLMMLEPERGELARARAVSAHEQAEAASTWSDALADAVVGEFLRRDEEALLTPRVEEQATLALIDCAYRRVIRARRADYSGILPRRRHLARVVEPLSAEAQRQELMWRYLNLLSTSSLNLDRVLIAKRALLSAASLDQRVNDLRRDGHDRDGILARVKPLAHRSHGDSRADELIDLLEELWARDPSERVLIAAQDNPTVDYLYDLVLARLPWIGPPGDRVRLVAARVRQGVGAEAATDIAARGNETFEHLEEFQRGDAVALFAPDVVSEGLNLQCARVLVLYSVPWAPRAIEQWIGRLDRIGNDAVFAGAHEARTVDIYTITQRGLVDEKIVAVLQRFQAFERNINLDGEHLDAITREIEEAALKRDTARLSALEERTAARAQEELGSDLTSPLKELLPWDAPRARALSAQLAALPPAPLSLKRRGDRDGAAGVTSWDRALEGLLSLLDQAGEYHIRNNKGAEGERFCTIWYKFAQTGFSKKKEPKAKVLFNFGADPSKDHSPIHAHAFLTQRAALTSPPRRSVTMTWEGQQARRPLLFFNFGSRLHDEIINGWLPTNAETHWLFVRFQRRDLKGDDPPHTKGALRDYVVTLSTLDPATLLSDERRDDAVAMIVAASAPDTAADGLLERLRIEPLVDVALEADRRWLRAQLCAELAVEGLKSAGRAWERATEEELAALFNPLEQRVRAERLAPDADERDRLARALEHLRERRDAAPSPWSPRYEAFDAALAQRRLIVQAEAEDASALAALHVEEAAARLRLNEAQGNKAQITIAAQKLAEARKRAAATRALWRARDEWLRGLSGAARAARPQERLSAILRVRAPAPG